LCETRVSDAHIRNREDTAHCVRQAGQTITAKHENILYAARLQVIENLEPEAGALGFFDPQSEHFLAAGNAYAQNGVDALFENPFLGAHRHSQAVHKHHRINPFQRAALPVGDLLVQMFGGARNELWGDFHAVDLPDMVLNLARAHAAGIKRNHRIGEVADRCLPFGDDLRIEVAVAVARRFDFHFPEIAAHGFGAAAVTGLAAAAAFGGVLRIPEMLLHFQFEECLQGLFDEPLHDRFGVHRRSSTLCPDLGHKEFLERLRILRQSGNVHCFCVFVHRAIPFLHFGFAPPRFRPLAGVCRRFSGVIK
jgi:hypothetical protein